MRDARPLEPEEIVIEAGRTESQYWRDIWRYRELFYFLAWRDLLVRYKQTVIGVSWAFLRPALTMVIFTILFGKIAQLPSEGVPYPLLVFAGILPWQLFAYGLSECSYSMTKNAGMISKVYFPRLIIPLSAVLTGLVDFGISALAFAGMMGWYGVLPDWRIVTLPLFLTLTLAASLGVGLWFAALNVKYRDFQHIIPFVIQIGVYVSPVGFTSSVIPEHYRWLYYLNPMAGTIDGFRWSTLPVEQALYLPGIVASVVLVLLLLIGGLWYFRRTERTFADII